MSSVVTVVIGTGHDGPPALHDVRPGAPRSPACHPRDATAAAAYSSVFTSVTSFVRLALASPKSMLVFSS
jgi:hypothetical protein